MLATSSSSSRFDSRYLSFASWKSGYTLAQVDIGVSRDHGGYSRGRRKAIYAQGDDVTYLVLLLPLVALLLETCNLPLEVFCLNIDLSQSNRCTDYGQS